MNSNFSSFTSSKNSSNSSSNTSINTMFSPLHKQNLIHELLLRIIEKKIQHNVELQNYDLDYINYDCKEKDQQYLIKVFDENNTKK